MNHIVNERYLSMASIFKVQIYFFTNIGWKKNKEVDFEVTIMDYIVIGNSILIKINKKYLNIKRTLKNSYYIKETYWTNFFKRYTKIFCKYYIYIYIYPKFISKILKILYFKYFTVFSSTYAMIV